MGEVGFVVIPTGDSGGTGWALPGFGPLQRSCRKCPSVSKPYRHFNPDYEPNPNVDPLRQHNLLLGIHRRRIETGAERLAQRLAELDTQMAEIVRQRREVALDLHRYRRLLCRTLRRPGRQPAPDASDALPPIHHEATWLSGRRLRSVCLAFLDRMGAMSLKELHAHLHRYGFAVGNVLPVKALADALGYEADHGRAGRVSRGVYECLVPPKSVPPLGFGGLDA